MAIGILSRDIIAKRVKGCQRKARAMQFQKIQQSEASFKERIETLRSGRYR